MKLNNITLYSFIALFSALSMISCKKDDIRIPDETNNLDNLKLVTSIKNDDHTINLYTKSGRLTTGYNEVFLQIKNDFGAALSTNSISWQPMMHMMDKSHSSPASNIVPLNGNPMINVGYIIFNMPSEEMGYWNLKIEYEINNAIKVAEGRVKVDASTRRIVQNFKGSDSVQYIVALIDPRLPKEGSNNLIAALYKMESMDLFTPVEDYKILIDPRMPGMNNHNSPNNKDLISQGKGIYNGKVNFSMTGYWKINLQVEDETGNIIKGEAITEETESSSIYFEVEF